MEKRGKWTVKKRKTIYKNPWMTVYEDQVIQPDGKDGIYGSVKYAPGVSMLPIDEQGNVYLIKQFAYSLNKYSIETATGAVEPGENPLNAAKRELKEELGIEAQEWTQLGQIDPFTGPVDSTAYIYLAKKLTLGKPELDPTEDITPLKMPFKEAIQLVMDGKITHAQSCVLILKTKEFLEKF